MKINKCLLSFLLVTACMSCSANNSLEVRVKVVDQNGLSVEGANVQVGFQSLGFGGSSAEGVTGKDGIYVANGESNLQYWVLVKKDGYYGSRLDQKEVKERVAPGEWKIVDQDVTLILREIKNPIPMYARRKASVNVPAYDTPIGYDMEMGDWVKPYGEGIRNDLIFLLSGYFNNFRDKSVSLNLSFSNKGDGIITVNPIEESCFKSPYEAPLENYKKEKKWKLFRKHTKGNHVQKTNESNDEQGKVYLVRVRTVLDENGNVREALYGKILGGIIFEGNVGDGRYTSLNIGNSYLNPDVNDRNLEYAVGRSLIDNLRKSETPRQP